MERGEVGVGLDEPEITVPSSDRSPQRLDRLIEVLGSTAAA